MTLFLGSLQLGLLYGIMVLGIYISFRILNIPDLTTEGSFTFGLVISALYASSGHPFLGLLLAIIAGAAAGIVTGFLQTKCKIHPVVAGILTMSGLYSINLYVMGGSSNLTLLGSKTVFTIAGEMLPNLDKDIIKILVALIAVLITVVLLVIFFKTHLGLAIRATGDNPDMVRASSINVDGMKITALGISNALIALCGGLITQYQSFADINSGVGILVVGLASVIIGEVFFGRRSILLGFISCFAGSIVYRYIIAIAIKSEWFPAYMLKLVSAIIVAAALAVPAIKSAMSVWKIKHNAAKGGSR